MICIFKRDTLALHQLKRPLGLGVALDHKDCAKVCANFKKEL